MIRIRVSIRYEDIVLSDNVSVMDGKVKYSMTGIRALGIQSTMLSFQSFELGPPTPHPPGSVLFPPLDPRGETHSLAGDPIPTNGKTLWYSMHTISPLRIRVSRINTLN